MPQGNIQTFQPNQHLRQLGRNKDGTQQEYLDVKWRILWLRTEHPDAHISTELVEHDPEGRRAVVRATVSIPDGGSASDYAQESAVTFPFQPHSYLEKAVTSAIGRALAALGYGTQFTTDHDFEQNTGRVVDSPVDRVGRGSTPAGPTVDQRFGQQTPTPETRKVAPLPVGIPAVPAQPRPDPDSPASEKTLQVLRELALKKGIPDERTLRQDIESFLTVDLPSLASLTYGQAQTYYRNLQTLPNLPGIG